MLVRWAGDGGHCPIHRHTATTTVLVLRGRAASLGSPPGRQPRRAPRAARGRLRADAGDALPHLERGGPEGGLVFFGNHSEDGLLYEILDEDLKLVVNVTMEVLVEDWKANT